jgi:hypothetical protein
MAGVAASDSVEIGFLALMVGDFWANGRSATYLS